MSVRPRLGVEVPELTARVARASNPAGTTAMWVRDRLDGDSRDRLLEDGRADRLLDLALARLKEAGLVRAQAHVSRYGQCQDDKESADKARSPQNPHS